MDSAILSIVELHQRKLQVKYVFLIEISTVKSTQLLRSAKATESDPDAKSARVSAPFQLRED